MRREQFSPDITNVAWLDDDDDPSKPTLTVGFDGSASSLRDRLLDTDGELLESEAIDVSFRLQGRHDDPEAAGVVALTSRHTGDYVLELNVDADEILTFVRAARRYGERRNDAGRYHVEIVIDDEPIVTYDKRTLLVYSRDGELLRQHSLIPSGVEI